MQYTERNLRDEQKAVALLQEKAKQLQWHEPITMMGYHVETEKQVREITASLTTAVPSLATWYHERLAEGFFDMPWPERKFLGEIAWPLGGVPFWKEALRDSDPDTRWQAALILGIAHVSETEKYLLGMLSDANDQVRAWAARALGQFTAVDAVKDLTTLTGDPSQRVRFQAHRALALIQKNERGIDFTTRFPAGESERAGKKILISDDDQESLDLCKLMWEKAGYKAVCTLGGEQTLELARRERPDLITTDILNPHMLGIDLIRELRIGTTTRETPIVVLSAYYLPWLGVFVGADAYIRQPAHPEELVRLMDQMLFA
ncbi:MAG TPA: HEAT repeat domain-containing protein [Anaerolineae bacterium]|nr:HEAT repeat domain-containing protein [Anaerolineae bacterium]